MPNYVKNKIVIGKSDYGKLLVNKYCKFNVKFNIYEFDFENVIKMPEDLKIEYSSKSNDALSLFLTYINSDISYYGLKKDKVDKEEFEIFCERLKQKTIFPLRFILKEDEIKPIIEKNKESEVSLLNLGKIQYQNLKKYGFFNWYEWSIVNWGTKWNAVNFEYEDDYKVLKFETAWDPAKPIILEISKQNPFMKFAFLYADEEIGANVGCLFIRNGEIGFEEYYDDFSCDAYKLAFDLWGCEDDYIYDDDLNTFVHKS